MTTYFTSESVAAGHPDNICDQISDAIVDSAIRCDKNSRVAVETLVTYNRIVLAGEVTCSQKLDYKKIVRKTIRRLGYTKSLYGFTDTSPISLYIHEQSPDIAKGVDNKGAGDQGMMFGYACRETPEFMPLPIMLAHRLVERMDFVRNHLILPYLRPDGKAEVKVTYEHGKPKEVETLVIAVPHTPTIGKSQLIQDVRKHVIIQVLHSYHLHIPQSHQIFINGTGSWNIGGPASDTGVTGRKIIVDTYGSFARHGGGCFSGKDPTKVDRSAAYACRYIAKNIVHQQLADAVEVRVAYVIGHQYPIDVSIDCFGTEHTSVRTIHSYIKKIIDLSVFGIIHDLSLLQPIYERSASYGHFGRDGFPWEAVLE